MVYETILSEVRDGVGLVTLNRPKALNALNARLIDELNHALGVTCIVVSHDVPEVLSIADYAYIVAAQHVIAEGTPEELQNNPDPRVRQFLDGIADGPVPFRFPAGDYKTELLG